MARSAQDLIPNGVYGVLERDTINTVPPMHLQHFLGFIGSDPNGLILLKQTDSPIHANRDDSDEKVKPCSSQRVPNAHSAAADPSLCV